nr:hypothetical protein [Pseudonocardia acaciae]
MTDRVEDAVAWVLASLGLVGGIVAVMIGLSTYADRLERARAEAASRTPAAAVLAQDTPPLTTPVSRGGVTSVRVPVRWTGSDGVARVGEVATGARLRAGDTVTVWADRDHHLVAAPLEPGQALVSGLVTGGVTLILVAVALRAIWWLVCLCTLARNRARWEDEWRVVGPLWSGRAVGGSKS